jgi:hypothetical protein
MKVTISLSDRIALLAAIVCAFIIAFARLIDFLGFWVHGMMLIVTISITWLILRREEHTRHILLIFIFTIISVSAFVFGFLQGAKFTAVFRDATPMLCLLLGMLLTTIPVQYSLVFMRTLLIASSLLMSCQLFIQYFTADHSTALAIYFYRADLPLYMSMVPLGAMLLMRTRHLLAWLVAVGMIIATFLSYGRVEAGVLIIMLGTFVFANVKHRGSYFLILLIVIIAGAGLILAGSSGGAGVGRLNLDTSDPSLGWRFIELAGFIDWWGDANIMTILFGQGLGSEILLPGTILSFNDTPSIPILHVSYLTWILKFGLTGLITLVGSIFYIFFNTTARRVLGANLLILTLACLSLRGLVQHGLFEPYGLFLLGLLGGLTRPALLDEGRQMNYIPAAGLRT